MLHYFIRLILILGSSGAIINIDASSLFLTPFIEHGKIAEGQQAAEVKPFLDDVKSYSGLLTVNKRYNSNLFFWFFKKHNGWREAPLIVWLQGGPGSPSTLGLFLENGPYMFQNGTLKRRCYSWTKYFNVLYIDNPVGVGYSFTDSHHGYATNQDEVGENLREAISQFMALFPQLRENKIIFSGESYAGKYLLALTHAIHSKQLDPPVDIYGLFMGNPLLSLEHMLYYSEYLYSHGLLDDDGADEMKRREKMIGLLIKSQNWTEASDLFAHTFFTGSYNNTLFTQLTGLRQHYNLLHDDHLEDTYKHFLNEPHVKEALHVETCNFLNGSVASRYLRADVAKSVKPWLEELLEHYRVLIYVGQLDIICPYYLQQLLFRQLSWRGSLDYFNADRKVLLWNKNLIGYSKTARKFTEVLVRNAGHFVPIQKPQWLLKLLRNYVNGYFDPREY